MSTLGKATLPMMDLDKQDCWAITSKNFVETTKTCTRPPPLLSEQLLLFLRITAVAVTLPAPESGRSLASIYLCVCSKSTWDLIEMFAAGLQEVCGGQLP